MKKPKKPRDPVILEEVWAKIRDAMADVVLCADGPIMMPVKYDDGSFKQKNIEPRLEFFYDYAYVGTRGDLIFGLAPEDMQEYRTVEVNEKKFDDIFPLALDPIVMKMGYSGTLGPTTFAELVSDVYAQLTVTSKFEEETAEEGLKALPQFGMF